MQVRSIRAVFVALAFVLASPFLGAERVQDVPQPTNYVSDLAGVLSPQTVQGLNALCRQVDLQAHAQIAVVTVKTLDGEPIESFTTALEDKWKVGAKGTDRGVILLFAIQDHKRRIETGYGLEGILPDSKVGVIGRSIVPQLQAGNYNAAISSAVVQVAQVIAADAGVDLQAAPRRGPPHREVQQISLGQLLIGGAVLLVIFFLLARFAPSGTIGFLLGMFLGGGFRGGVEVVLVATAAVAEGLAVSAGEAPAAAARQETGKIRLQSRRDIVVASDPRI